MLVSLLRRRWRLVAALWFAVTAVVLATFGTIETWPVALAALGVVVATYVEVPTVSGSRLTLVAGVGAALPILLLTVDQQSDLRSIVAAFALGLMVAFLLRVVTGAAGPTETGQFVRTSVGVTAYLLVLWATADFATDMSFREFRVSTSGIELAILFCAGATWFFIESAMWAWLTVDPRHRSKRYRFLLALSDWSVALGSFASGALFGVAFKPIGPVWAFLVAAVPFGFVWVTFRRSHETRKTYGQTIRSLAQIPEVAGLSPAGHGDRTAELAEAMAEVRRMTPDRITRVRYAGLMHDIGTITLTEPAIIRAGYTDADIARWGSQIVAEAPYLEDVAAIVLQQHEPYRRPGEERDEVLPDEARIIKVASAYDRALHEQGRTPLEALEELHRGAAYEYDPGVVQALRKVLTSRGTI